jgi:hypothetical protein
MSNTKKPQTWSNLLQADREPEKEGPSTFDRFAATLGAAGSVAVGAAVEHGFAGTGEFVSRFFGLPEVANGSQPSERQAEPAQEQDKDRDAGRDR